MPSNLWNRFWQILNVTDFRVGEVISSGTETSVLEDVNGYQFTAIGTGVTVGQKAFVRNGVIVGQAPTLTNPGDVYV